MTHFYLIDDQCNFVEEERGYPFKMEDETHEVLCKQWSDDLVVKLVGKKSLSRIYENKTTT